MCKLNGYISDYFFIAKKVVEQFQPNNNVVLQFFQTKNKTILAGISEALLFLKENLPNKNTVIRYLEDGSEISEREVVLELEGKYQDFGIFEGIIDGILSRATSIATNARNCVIAANKKEVICMSDRSDHYCNQIRDAEAMVIGGITSFSTQNQSLKKYTVYGSIPHALIQNFNGNLLLCMQHYQHLYPQDELVGLVDYHNNVIKDSLLLWNHFKNTLKGVRVDTSIANRDEMFQNNEQEFGVTPNQIKKLRKALDDVGANSVKIFVSSGFTPEKIKFFEDEKTPVDGYGVGQYLLKVNNFFCADATKLNGQMVAKVGRKYRENPKLKLFKWE